MERMPRDCKKLKLAESGKPDLNTPWSTMEKFKGGTKSSSLSLSLSFAISGACSAGDIDGDNWIAVQVSPREINSVRAKIQKKNRTLVLLWYDFSYKKLVEE